MEGHSESKGTRNILRDEKGSHEGNPSPWAQPNKTPQEEKEETHSEEHIAKEHSTFLKKQNKIKPTQTKRLLAENLPLTGTEVFTAYCLWLQLGQK